MCVLNTTTKLGTTNSNCTLVPPMRPVVSAPLHVAFVLVDPPLFCYSLCFDYRILKNLKLQNEWITSLLINKMLIPFTV